MDQGIPGSPVGGLDYFVVPVHGNGMTDIFKLSGRRGGLGCWVGGEKFTQVRRPEKGTGSSTRGFIAAPRALGSRAAASLRKLEIFVLTFKPEVDA